MPTRTLPSPRARITPGALVSLACTLVSAGLFAGCGSPGAPQPPSLNLPQPVSNLTAERHGNIVTLAWTTPTQSTDKLPLKKPVESLICRQPADANPPSGSSCVPVATLRLSPGKTASHEDILPPDLLSGPLRPIRYYVDSSNEHGHSAGPSNIALSLAGASPAPVTGLHLTVREDGVLLNWDSVPSNDSLAARIHREEILPPQPAPKPGGPNPEPPPFANLAVAPKPGQPANSAFDPTAQLGHTYRYTVERTASLPAGGATLLLHGPASSPVTIETIDHFPPQPPSGLVAIPVAADTGNNPAVIDLSWSPNSEPDLAGYIVYRRLSTEASPARISGPQPLPGSAFRDSSIQPGQTYTYAVSAIDRSGNESPQSSTAEATASQP